GMLDRMAIAVEGAPVTERGVAGDRSAALGDENGKSPRLALSEPFGAVGEIDLNVVPDGGRIGHSIVIDHRDGRQVGFGGIADDDRGNGGWGRHEGPIAKGMSGIGNTGKNVRATAGNC